MDSDLSRIEMSDHLRKSRRVSNPAVSIVRVGLPYGDIDLYNAIAPDSGNAVIRKVFSAKPSYVDDGLSDLYYPLIKFDNSNLPAALGENPRDDFIDSEIYANRGVYSFSSEKRDSGNNAQSRNGKGKSQVYDGTNNRKLVGFALLSNDPVSQVRDRTEAFTFTVTRSGVLNIPVTVRWEIFPLVGAYCAPQDFPGGVYPNGLISFANGQTTATFSFTTSKTMEGTSFPEAQRNATVRLISPSNGAKIIDANTSFQFGHLYDCILDVLDGVTGEHRRSGIFTGANGPYTYETELSGEVLRIWIVNRNGERVSSPHDPGSDIFPGRGDTYTVTLR